MRLTVMNCDAAVHRDELTRCGVLSGLGWGVQSEPCVVGESPPDCDYQVAREGDLIIVQERYDCLTHLKLEANGVLHNRYGRFLHADVIGRRLGMRWDAVGRPGGPQGRACRGFVYALAPSPPLWSLAMHHRTQVVYPHDSAIISLYLDLRPGSILVESGTGAGSASIAFARVVAPHGRVLSFEFHAERAAAAEADFVALGLASIVKVHAGHDVLRDGFAPVPSGSVDAVFLDLPAPYHMIAEAARVLRPDGALCSFSPCIEQVQRTCAELRSDLFHSVRTVTAPVRSYETRAHVRSTPGFDELSRGELPSVRKQRLDNGHGDTQIRTNAESKGAELHVDDAVIAASGTGSSDGSVARKPAVGHKRSRREYTSAAGERSLVYAAHEAQEGELAGRVLPPPAAVRSRPFPNMKGHTSYLTFARRTRREIEADRALGAAVEKAGSTTNRCKTM